MSRVNVQIEPKDVVRIMQVPNLQPESPRATPPLPSAEPDHDLLECPADANWAARLHPTTHDAPTKMTQTSYSALRASIGSGDTFGVRRRRWSMSYPIDEGTEDEDALSTAQEASSVCLSDTEGGVIDAKAAKHVRNDRASRRFSRRSGSSTSSRTSSQQAGGLDPRSRARRHAHRRPETYEEIVRQLLDLAAKDKNRIVPSAFADLPVLTSPSHEGLTLGGLQSTTGDEDDDGVVADALASNANARGAKGLPRKIIQLLGEGAAEAGLAHQRERRMLQDALVRSVHIQSFRNA